MYSFDHSCFSKNLLILYILIVIMRAFTEHVLSIKRLRNEKLLPSGRKQTLLTKSP